MLAAHASLVLRHVARSPSSAVAARISALSALRSDSFAVGGVSAAWTHHISVLALHEVHCRVVLLRMDGSRVLAVLIIPLAG